LRLDAVVLGDLHLDRPDPDNSFQDGDDRLTQVVDDRIGSAIDESHVRELLEQRTERRAAALRMQELTLERRGLLDELSGVEERERTLLAEAIHDGPMQLLVAVAMQLQHLGMSVPPDVQDGLDTSIGILQTAIRSMRTPIIALSPPDLSRGLRIALRHLAEEIFIGTATAITVKGTADVNLSGPSKIGAHRILREALVNTRKHAQARHIELELTENGNTVIARLTDDGVGAASLDAGPGHLGMATMRARAAAAGAVLTITSTPGTGTTVLLTLPAGGR
jgi:signal transduction histidine kinase